MAKFKKAALIASLEEDNSLYTLGQNQVPVNVLDGKVLCTFVDNFLLPFYDDPQPTPDFHQGMMDLYCSSDKKVAVAAPRGCGKTTSNTIAYTLANVLFHCADFIMIGSNTEEQAIKILDAIRLHLVFNSEIKSVWNRLSLTRDTQTEIIGTTDGEHYFKIQVKSSTQQFRGAVWGVKRPNLILLDDFESPEDVLSKEMREKIYNKFSTDILMCGSSYCRFRVTGTILHEDSLLEKLMQSKSWKSLRYAAHNPDFSKILFPGKFSKESLQEMMAEFDEQGKLDMYYREMLNLAVATGDTLFQEHQFQPMEYEDKDGKRIDRWQRHMEYFVTIDFAISEKQKADFTVFLVFGICSEGMIHIVHLVRFRASPETPMRIQDTFFEINEQFRPVCFIAETEKIDKAIMPYIRAEMVKRNRFFTVLQIPSSKSKVQRLMGIANRMTARTCYFNKEAYWFPEFKRELMQATPSGIKSAHDDQADTFGMISMFLDRYYTGMTDEEVVVRAEADDYYEQIEEQKETDGYQDGVCPVTGY